MNIAYLRCSTNKQDLEHQQSSITSYCSNNNIEIERLQNVGIPTERNFSLCEYQAEEGGRITLLSSYTHRRHRLNGWADRIEHSKVSMMLKSVDDDEKVKVSNVYVEGRCLKGISNVYALF